MSLITKILITGTTGFVGMHLVDELKKYNYKVKCLVRKNLEKAGIELIYGNLSNKDSIDAATKNTDIIIHLAGVIKAKKEDYEKINVGGTKNLVDSSIKNNVKKIIFFSSILVKEKDDPYGQSKLKSELLIQESGINYTIFRPTIIYGSGDKKNITKLIKLVKKYPVIPVWGGGDYLIQPVHVNDVVKTTALAIKNKKTDGKIYNIAGPSPISYNNMIDIISKNLNKKRVKMHIPLFLFKPFVYIYQTFSKNPVITTKQLSYLTKNNIVDIAEAKRDLKFNPIDIEEGLAQCISQYREI